MLREGIPTMRFTAKECREKPGEVMSEVLGVRLIDCLSKVEVPFLIESLLEPSVFVLFPNLLRHLDSHLSLCFS
ncbi:MAG: hypothetical protein RLZZ490_157, partial [Cyanobacteriota bacterium]